ncbi:carboxypeptidase-like regulatory domain-containing protein [Hymenobacter busanensis]|nr:carboxypeptidase-like regulatory domain-containing protein [Hymenobacter busanensis]QHJ08455.1 hypothetical protein GUY19_14640 [Hymenobacter busanensis]
MKTVIRIPQPCHEDWQLMTPTVTGRHCTACQKVVIDFTQKTDAELLAYFRQHRGNTCGRFAAHQVARPLLEPAASAPRWRTWLAAVFALWGLRELSAEASVAQAVEKVASSAPAVERAAELAEPIGPEASPFNAAPIVVRGRVIDSTNGEPLPGATILLKGTTIGISTAADGTFSFTIPSEKADTYSTLVVFSIGYVNLERPVDSSMQQANIDLGLSVDIKGNFEMPPWYSPRSLWWRITQPFRRY